LCSIYSLSATDVVKVSIPLSSWECHVTAAVYCVMNFL
jgi:hypothetical protein